MSRKHRKVQKTAPKTQGIATTRGTNSREQNPPLGHEEVATAETIAALIILRLALDGSSGHRGVTMPQKHPDTESVGGSGVSHENRQEPEIQAALGRLLKRAS
jgi:hypothetical protein